MSTSVDCYLQAVDERVAVENGIPKEVIDHGGLVREQTWVPGETVSRVKMDGESEAGVMGTQVIYEGYEGSQWMAGHMGSIPIFLLTYHYIVSVATQCYSQ